MPVYICIYVSFLAFNLSSTSVIHKYFPILHFTVSKITPVTENTQLHQVLNSHQWSCWWKCDFARKPRLQDLKLCSKHLEVPCNPCLIGQQLQRCISSSLLRLRLTRCASQRIESVSWHNTLVLVFLNSRSFLEQGDDCMLLQHYKWKVKCLKATKRKMLVCKHNAKSALPGVSLCVPLALLGCDLTLGHGAWLWPDPWASAGASQGREHSGLHPGSGPVILRKAPEALFYPVKVEQLLKPQEVMQQCKSTMLILCILTHT